MSPKIFNSWYNIKAYIYYTVDTKEKKENCEFIIIYPCLTRISKKVTNLDINFEA